MKKLLLLLLLVGFSAVGADKPKTEFDKDGNILVRINGADKPRPLTAIEKENLELLLKGPKWSLTGLEGIDDSGIRVVRFVPAKGNKNFDHKAIADQVELRLRQEKLNYNDEGANFITINALPLMLGSRLTGYSVQLQVSRRIYFQAKTVQYKTTAVVWQQGGVCSPSSLRSHLDKILNNLLMDYRDANPKKD